MATVTTNWLPGGLSASEEQGTFTTATRSFLVSGLTDSDTGILDSALAASGIPDYGDSYPGNANLIVTKRDAKVLDESNNRKVRVDVTYQYLAADDGQFVFSGSTSITEETTNSDANGNAVTLTYGDDTQLAEMSVTVAEITVSATGILAVVSPVQMQIDWIGYTNADAWNGLPPNHWLCTRCDWVPHDLAATPARYKFTFEFQAKRRGYVQNVYYRDSSGNIPPDLVYGVGRKRVVVQGYRSFGERFPT
jgi:hypothetical protein